MSHDYDLVRAVVEEDTLGAYNRYICPFCRKVVCTGRAGYFNPDLWDKLKDHIKVCKRYQAAAACGKVQPNKLCFKIISYRTF